MEIGLYTFAELYPDPVTGETISPEQRIRNLLEEVESAVYFSCLEAMQNVAKYAHASHVTIDLEEAGASLRFSVVDDGVGFDVDATSYGTGLQGMADRLDAISGSLEVRSALGEGTTIEGLVPLGA